MWNDKEAVKFLGEKNTDNKDLKTMQSQIDEHKFNNSVSQGYDLCGSYATFCQYCDKSLMYPCANAYLKNQAAMQSIQTQNNSVEKTEAVQTVSDEDKLTARQASEQMVVKNEQVAVDSVFMQTEDVSLVKEEEDQPNEFIEPIVQIETEVVENNHAEQQTVQTERVVEISRPSKIRIAIARRKK